MCILDNMIDKIVEDAVTRHMSNGIWLDLGLVAARNSSPMQVWRQQNDAEESFEATGVWAQTFVSRPVAMTANGKDVEVYLDPLQT